MTHKGRIRCQPCGVNYMNPFRFRMTAQLRAGYDGAVLVRRAAGRIWQHAC